MTSPDQDSHRLFTRRFAPPMAIYVLLLIFMIPMIRNAGTPVVGVLLALVPLLPLSWAMFELVRYIGGLDEMQRRLHFEAGGIAGLVTCALVFSWTFMEMAGLPELRAVAVLPLFCAIYSFRYWQTARRIG